MYSRDDEPVRVLMIAPQFRPLVGGYEHAAERLSAALVEAGLRIVVITERRDPVWPSTEQLDGYEVRRLFCWYRPKLHTVTSLASFAFFLLRYGREFDVWHVHQYGFHAALAVTLGKAMNRPVVLKLTNSGPMGIAATLGSGPVGKILGVVHRRVTACVAVTEETRVEAVGFGIPAERIYLIPNGVDGRQFRPASPDERGTARRALAMDCKMLVLFVGRLSPEKNLPGLLDAWAALDASVREGALLALVGDGPDASRLRARVQASKVAGSIHLAGHRSDVATWYRAADFYVISSINEGLSNTMIEALASGLPVISTRVSGSSVLAGPPTAGLLVDVGDAQGLADAMKGLMSEESTRIRLGANARLTFEASFSLKALAARTILLYEGLRDRNERRATA